MNDIQIYFNEHGTNTITNNQITLARGMYTSLLGG